jgi:hypothetical protein
MASLRSAGMRPALTSDDFPDPESPITQTNRWFPSAPTRCVTSRAAEEDGCLVLSEGPQPRIGRALIPVESRIWPQRPREGFDLRLPFQANQLAALVQQRGQRRQTGQHFDLVARARVSISSTLN